MEKGIQQQLEQFTEQMVAHCSAESLLNMGHWFALYTEPVNAVPWYKAATETDPEDYRGWFFLGLASLESGDATGAVEALERAAAVRTTVEVQRELARTHYAAGAYDTAFEMSQSLIDSNDDDGARIIAVDILTAQGEKDVARSMLETVRNRHPGSSGVEYRLRRLTDDNPADITRNSQQTGLALDSPLLRARQRLDVSSRMMHLRGAAAAEQGDCARAQYWFQEAIKAAPGVSEHEENYEKLLATVCRQQ